MQRQKGAVLTGLLYTGFSRTTRRMLAGRVHVAPGPSATRNGTWDALFARRRGDIHSTPRCALTGSSLCNTMLVVGS